MAITFDELKKLVTNEGLRFFVDPNLPRVMFGMTGMFGKYQIVVSLMDDGQFLQLRCVNNIYCPSGHPHLAEVQNVLATLNLSYRLVKFAWDASDGEIVAMADHWIMDNTLSPIQLSRIMGNYLPALDMASQRIRATIETGKDPGEMKPDELIESLAGGSDGLSGALKKLVDKLRGKNAGTDDVDEL